MIWQFSYHTPYQPETPISVSGWYGCLGLIWGMIWKLPYNNLYLLLHKKLCCGYSLEALHKGTSNEYPQHMFLWKNGENHLKNYHQILPNNSSVHYDWYLTSGVNHPGISIFKIFSIRLKHKILGWLFIWMLCIRDGIHDGQFWFPLQLHDNGPGFWMNHSSR